MGDELASWVLYENPLDFPGEWVVRRQVAAAGNLYPDAEIAARGTTREACVKVLLEKHPKVQGMAWIPRHPTDDPVIDGCWM